MSKVKLFLSTLDVRAAIGGKHYENMTAVGSVELTVDRHGRGLVSPVVLEGVVEAGKPGLAELLGSRPWRRRDVTLVCQGREGGPARVVRLRRCRFRGLHLSAVELDGEPLRERVTLHPARVDVHTAKGGGERCE